MPKHDKDYSMDTLEDWHEERAPLDETEKTLHFLQNIEELLMIIHLDLKHLRQSPKDDPDQGQT